MFGWTKKPKSKIKELLEEDVTNEQIPINSPDEQELMARIVADFEDSQSVRQGDTDETGWSIEEQWEDDYKLYKGKGLQWLTNFARRSRASMMNRPNSERNIIFNTIEVQKSNITANTPEISLQGVEEQDQEMADKITFASKFNDDRNKFVELFKKWVHDFTTSGPAIGMVVWDSEWIGGKGPKRWVGDVRLLHIPKEEMFFDPAIKDLEHYMQDCSYIIRRPRKKLYALSSRWENGKLVGVQYNEDDNINEGGNPRQTYLMEYWHRGFPFFVPSERKKELLAEADRFEQEGDIYRANDYRDAAKGELEGVHVAYYADDVLLEYRPYEYEDGLYPFVFTTKYFDEKCQWGWGEIRNLSIPQVLHNKADEIEFEAMIKEGLGGYFYQKGALNLNQKNKILDNAAKGGQYFEVDNLGGMKAREGVRVPNSVKEYRRDKEDFMNGNQPATTIQQGISPGANVPFATVRELGARSDVRMKQVSDKLEDFLIRINQLRISRFVQFYTEERYYRIRGADGKVQEGTITRNDMLQSWDREMIPGQDGQMIPQKEFFVPDFDIKCTIMSEKPTDRNYYTQLAMQLYNMQLLSPEDLYYTLEEGKMPPNKDILQHIYARQPIMEVMSQIQNLPQEMQQHIMDTLKQSIQQTQQMVAGQMQEQQMMQAAQEQQKQMGGNING